MDENSESSSCGWEFINQDSNRLLSSDGSLSDNSESSIEVVSLDTSDNDLPGSTSQPLVSASGPFFVLRVPSKDAELATDSDDSDVTSHLTSSSRRQKKVKTRVSSKSEDLPEKRAAQLTAGTSSEEDVQVLSTGSRQDVSEKEESIGDDIVQDFQMVDILQENEVNDEAGPSDVAQNEGPDVEGPSVDSQNNHEEPEESAEQEHPLGVIDLPVEDDFMFLGVPQDDPDTESSPEMDEQDDRMESDRGEDHHSDDNSTLSNIDISDLMAENNLIRQYVFRPNSTLNVTLNMMVIIVICVAVGLGIGHAIGSAKERIKSMNNIKELSFNADDDCPSVIKDVEKLHTENLELKEEANKVQNEVVDLRSEVMRLRYSAAFYEPERRGYDLKQLHLKTQLNLLQHENQDLKNMIGSLKYGSHPGNTGNGNMAGEDYKSAEQHLKCNTDEDTKIQSTDDTKTQPTDEDPKIQSTDDTKSQPTDEDTKVQSTDDTKTQPTDEDTKVQPTDVEGIKSRFGSDILRQKIQEQIQKTEKVKLNKNMDGEKTSLEIQDKKTTDEERRDVEKNIDIGSMEADPIKTAKEEVIFDSTAQKQDKSGERFDTEIGGEGHDIEYDSQKIEDMEDEKYVKVDVTSDIEIEHDNDMSNEEWKSKDTSRKAKKIKHVDGKTESKGHWQDGNERTNKEEKSNESNDRRGGINWKEAMHTILNKTKVSMSDVSKQIQDTWKQVKNMSDDLWKKNKPVITKLKTRLANKVENVAKKMSEKIQQKTQSWIQKGKKYYHKFSKHYTKHGFDPRKYYNRDEDSYPRHRQNDDLYMKSTSHSNQKWDNSYPKHKQNDDLHTENKRDKRTNSYPKHKQNDDLYRKKDNQKWRTFQASTGRRPDQEQAQKPWKQRHHHKHQRKGASKFYKMKGKMEKLNRHNYCKMNLKHREKYFSILEHFDNLFGVDFLSDMDQTWYNCQWDWWWNSITYHLNHLLLIDPMCNNNLYEWQEGILRSGSWVCKDENHFNKHSREKKHHKRFQGHQKFYQQRDKHKDEDIGQDYSSRFKHGGVGKDENYYFKGRYHHRFNDELDDEQHDFQHEYYHSTVDDDDDKEERYFSDDTFQKSNDTEEFHKCDLTKGICDFNKNDSWFQKKMKFRQFQRFVDEREKLKSNWMFARAHHREDERIKGHDDSQISCVDF